MSEGIVNIVLLSGGSGSRLWPLSNEVRSKQFLRIFKNEDGSKESMVQRVYRMIKEVETDSKILIATSSNQLPQISVALGDKVDVSIEPCRRDTFPAISLACAYLKKNGLNDDVPVIISPVDPYVDIDYFRMFKKMVEISDNANITLMGIKPAYPSEKYGYILPKGKFIEKPNKREAEKMIKAGALWNSGVYCFQLKYILSKAKELLGHSDYESIYNNYDKLKKISIDYAVAEKEPSIQIVSYDGQWKDLGSWNTLTESMSENISGNAILDDSNNTHLINELSIPMVTIGINNAVVVATPDGILVSDKEKSSRIKDLVKNARPMYEKRAWGEYRVLDYKVQSDKKNSLTKELIINKNQHISYQSHMHRTEVWTIVGGKGKLILDGSIKDVVFGDTVVIKPNMQHGIKAIEDLHIIEVQFGDELIEEDINRYDYDWELV